MARKQEEARRQAEEARRREEETEEEPIVEVEEEEVIVPTEEEVAEKEKEEVLSISAAEKRLDEIKSLAAEKEEAYKGLMELGEGITNLDQKLAQAIATFNKHYLALILLVIERELRGLRINSQKAKQVLRKVEAFMESFEKEYIDEELDALTRETMRETQERFTHILDLIKVRIQEKIQKRQELGKISSE